MEKSLTTKVDTNASPSAYGWAFQVGAGITLMLDNIKYFDSLKMEGASDDIELRLPDGKIYAQAKSVTRIGDQSTASTNLQKSLNLLNSDNKNGDALQLIYITNIVNPLSSKQASAFAYGHTYDFSVLSDNDQKKILKWVDNSFPTSKFKVYIINFFGEGENKFDSVKEKIAEFLRTAINDASYDKQLLDAWVETFFVNCTDKPDKEKTFEMSKKEIIFPVIALVIMPPISETEFSKVCDYDDFDELVQEYRRITNRKLCDYEFVASVIGDYISQWSSQKDTSDFKYIYVRNNWKSFEQFFSTIQEASKREALIKLILLTIITRRSRVNKIKEAANLC